ncbi:hypothetical protein KAI04_03110 [Candidatus Pacearchaeota archaeon]|nr:hypothetical protein [Candidatus Pacearchaeota archaeon]
MDEKDCSDCVSYILVKKRVKCGDGNNMGEMKKEGLPCFSDNYSVLSYSVNKDEFDNRNEN